MVGTGTEGPVEDGLGAVRLTVESTQAVTGAPVSAREYVCTPQGPCREARVKQGGTTKRWLSSLNLIQGRFFVLRTGKDNNEKENES